MEKSTKRRLALGVGTLGVGVALAGILTCAPGENGEARTFRNRIKP